MRPERALYWEYGRQAWPVVISLSFAGCALAGLYRAALRPLGEQRDTLAFVAVLSTLAIASVLAIMSVTAEGLALGFERRLFRLPLPTWRLALARQVGAVLASSSILALVILGSRALYGVHWPLAAPILSTAVILVWAQTISWALAEVPLLIPPASAPVAGMLYLLLRPHLRSPEPFESFAFPHAVALSGLFAVGAGAGVYAVVLDRAGRRISAAGLAPRLRRLEARRQISFSTPAAALLWREWAEKGKLLCTWSLLAVLVNLVLSSSGLTSFSAQRFVQGAVAFAGFLLLAGPGIAGFLHSRFDLASRDPGIDRARATLPIGNRDLAWTLLLAIQRTLACAWIVLIAVSSLVVLTFAAKDARMPLASFLEAAINRPSTVLVVAGLALLWSWLVGGLVATLVLTGRNSVIGLGVFTPYAVIGVTSVAQRVTGRDIFTTVATPVALSLAPALLLATIVAVVVALRHHLLELAPTLGAMTLLAFLGLSAGQHLQEITQLHPGGSLNAMDMLTTFALPAFACSALLPVALAPIALGWNRHR